MGKITSTVAQTQIEGFPLRRGKVRDVYDLGDELLIVATDRISAYDVVLPTPIPGKGAMLTKMAAFWFDWLGDDVPHHLIQVVDERVPADMGRWSDQILGRSMRCRKAEVVPIECVVRGYLAGSGWREYVETGRVCGIQLRRGLRECEQLNEPIFTPALKADVGHDENVSFERASEVAGEEVMTALRDRSLAIYDRAARYARSRGIIVADTKFEWGRCGDELILIDEVLTPDSSRFWPADRYEPGRDQDSFDKQFVRDYLTSLVARGAWDKRPPGPELPESIVRQTAEKYSAAVDALVG